MASHNTAATKTSEVDGETDKKLTSTIAEDTETPTGCSADKDWADTVQFGFDSTITDNQYEVNDLRNAKTSPEGDWMSRLLLSKEFQLLPANNLQAIFARLEPIEYSAGTHIIEQGEPGEFFYIITQGRCVVTRKLPTGTECIILAELTVGDTFGEEALITDATRQATITMVTDGSAMRLSKADFKELLSGPIISYVDSETASDIIAAGGQWLDVSMQKPRQSEQEPDTVYIPMYMLRLKLDGLDAAAIYVITSGDTTHSCAAAHVLSQYGFQAKVLNPESQN